MHRLTPQHRNWFQRRRAFSSTAVRSSTLAPDFHQRFSQWWQELNVTSD